MIMRKVNPLLFIPVRDRLLCFNCRLLKNEILYNLSLRSVIIENITPPAFLLRYIFFSVCTATAPFGFF